MVTDEQVRLLRKKMSEGKTIASAAAAAGISERSAYTWKQGALPSESKGARPWRTRTDPFAGVWDSEVTPLLASDEHSVLEGTTVLAELRRRHGEQYGPSLLRTLQRRMHEWRALHGPGSVAGPKGFAGNSAGSSQSSRWTKPLRGSVASHRRRCTRVGSRRTA